MKAAPTVQPLLTFGQCLKNILGARKLPASALSRMMEQKSRNSMFRILDDTGGPAVQAAFFESLKASDCLHLTEQEERELERALEVSRFGVAGYMTNQAMHRLLGDVDLQAARGRFPSRGSQPGRLGDDAARIYGAAGRRTKARAFRHHGLLLPQGA